MVVQWLVLLPHSEKILGLVWFLVLSEFAHSPHVHVGFLKGLWFPPMIQKYAGYID